MWVYVTRTVKTEAWCVVIACVMVIMVLEVNALSGPNVCMVKQKYNITKRVKYRAPMSVRTYEWCFSMPPRCSKWTTEMRDLTRLETEERIAEVAVCCPGYKMKDISCVPICTNGKTGPGCTEDCPPNKWGPNCINTCNKCKNGFCSRLTGECECVAGWQGESCDTNIPPMTTSTPLEELLTTLTTKITNTNITPKSTTFSSAITQKPAIKTQITEVTSTETLAFPATSVTTIVKTTPIIRTTESATKLTILKVPTTSRNLTTTSTTNAPQIKSTTEKTIDEIISFVSNITMKSTTDKTIDEVTSFVTTTTTSTRRSDPTTEQINNIYLNVPDNIKEIEYVKTTEVITSVKEIPTISVQQSPKAEIISATKFPPTTTSIINLSKETIHNATSRTESPTIKLSKEISHNETPRIESTTIKLIQNTPKIKPKEIWIRPAQKGETPVDAKIKMAHEFPRYRSANNKELISPITTPKTIIVSIIPTSVSYSTFKRIALTSSYLANKNSTNAPSYNISFNRSVTKAMSAVTNKPPMKLSTISKEVITSMPDATNTTALTSTSVTPIISSSKSETKSMDIITKLPVINKTNSMITYNITSSKSDIEISVGTSTARNDIQRNPVRGQVKSLVQTSAEQTTRNFTQQTRYLVEQITSKYPANVTLLTHPQYKTNTSKVIKNEIKPANVTKPNLTRLTTDDPKDDEEFHILTEPEHITAVMGDKGTDRSSVDLISVISIAGGVMMAIITVAVIIVMIERCKKPRYEDIRKINDIRMQVMIDNSEAPPPYVRSIFHTPLPEPPTSERCHYQPISTLDRNLKQFMRPVVVQTISPIMLENFREILECHYDHLPRRSHDFEAIQMRSSLAPSMKNSNELEQLHASMTESTIEALKCEAKLDVIDNTTSEPLYAEIPCWRPPSEHAVEILNLNGEAVTEL